MIAYILHISVLSHLTNVILCNFNSFLNFGCFYWFVYLFFCLYCLIFYWVMSLFHSIFSPSWILVPHILNFLTLCSLTLIRSSMLSLVLFLCAILWITYSNLSSFLVILSVMFLICYENRQLFFLISRTSIWLLFEIYSVSFLQFSVSIGIFKLILYVIIINLDVLQSLSNSFNIYEVI